MAQTRGNRKNDKTGEVVAGLFGDVLSNVTEVSGYYMGVPQAEAAAAAQSAVAQAEASAQAATAGAIADAFSNAAVIAGVLALGTIGTLVFLARR